MNSKLKMYTAFVFILFCLQLQAQNRVSGYVFDKQSGERLIGASVYEFAGLRGTATNNNGYFSYISQGGEITVSFIGYKSLNLNINSDTILYVYLESGRELGEVTVYGQQQERGSNISALSMHEMLSIPALGGKPDVLKSLHLMPGIQAQQEGASLISVRGGAPGENLYLIDNVPLIYVNHLGGFTSVFNPDMINNVEVYKGGFPAKYGGKLSSIVSINQREGDKNTIKGALSYGLTDVSGVIEGPLFGQNSSFIVTARKTLTESLMMLASSFSKGGDFIVGYGFHDVNAKLSWRPDKRNSFFVNVYQGDDYLFYFSKTSYVEKEKSKLTNMWGNWLASARWNRVFSTKLTADNTLSITHYRLKIVQRFESFSKFDTINFYMESKSSVRDASFRSDWNLKLNNSIAFDFGGKLTHYGYVPNQTLRNNEHTNFKTEKTGAFETSVYVGTNINLWKFASFDAGGRLVGYYAPDYSNVVFEPRVSFNIHLTQKQMLNFSYHDVNQFSHLLFTSGSIMNNEIWLPVGKGIEPSKSVQYTAGWSGNFFNNMLEAELNFYTKSMQNLVVYKEGYSNLLGDGGWRNKIEPQGSGHSRGLELLIKKTHGKLTGFAAYTWSKTTRRFDAINGGKAYLFDFDRPHSIAAHINYTLSEVWSVSAAWVYQSGQPFTPVIGRKMVPVDIQSGNVYCEEALIYGERNSHRMIDYHRLDLGAVRKVTNKNGRRAEWIYSVYNAYSRRNANAYVYGDGRHLNSGILIKNRPYKVSFFPIIPTVSYRVYFD
jgi:hypothetical protein